MHRNQLADAVAGRISVASLEQHTGRNPERYPFAATHRQPVT